MGIEKLDRIFNTKRIAVIDAFKSEDSVGDKILRNLMASGFAGKIFSVKQSKRMVQGVATFSQISQIPEQVDLVVIAAPTHTIPLIVKECGISGVQAVIIVSSGFEEATDQGSDLELIREYQRKYGLRIVGPNSFGVIITRTNMFATFAEKLAVPGKTTFISQSNILFESALDWAWDNQIGFSAVVSTGSMLDVDLGDLIDYFRLDPQTKSLMLYVESLKNPRKFMSAARECAHDKPIVVLKADHLREGKEDKLLHGNSLMEDAVYQAAFKRAGIVQVETANELFNCAAALAVQPNPSRNSLTIVTNASAPSTLATDCLTAKGGKLSHLTTETIQALKNALPIGCNIINPVNIYEEATLVKFRSVLEICLRDSASDGFLVVWKPRGAVDPLSFAQMIVELVKPSGKPLLICLISQNDHCQEARKILQRGGIPSFTTPEEAISTFMNMYRYTQNLELLYQTPKEVKLAQTPTTLLKGILRRVFCEGRATLTLSEAMQFLEDYRIPTARTVIARTADEAKIASSQIGYPVVMKALFPQVTNKSRIEGVILNVESPSEVEIFFKELEAKVKKYSDVAEFQGVAIQQMVREKSLELMLGSKNDAKFGKVILFGNCASSSNDLIVGFPPLNQVLAKQLIEETSSFKQASGAGISSNVKLLEEILVRFSQLVADFPEIAAIDVNPLIAGRDSVVAVDVRIVIDWDRLMREVAEHSEHSLIATYPKKYVAHRTLKSGVEVLLRPVKAEDEGRFNALIKSLSAQSMRFRFFEVFKEMPHETLARFCNLDYDRQIAIVAELQDGDKQIIGVSGVIVEPNGKTGEFAILVGDQWQGLGLGSVLMNYVIDFARDLHLKKLLGYVLANNDKMMKLCVKKGFELEKLDEETAKASLTLS